MVKVVALAVPNNAFTVQCDFITGSDAEGCMVMLVGEFGNSTVTLTRSNNSQVFNATHPLSCYHEVLAYDIESDGSTGTLAVPGLLVRNSSRTESCDLSTSNLHSFY